MPDTPLLSQILLQLSDAIEELALLLAKQKVADKDESFKKLQLLTQKIKNLQNGNNTDDKDKLKKKFRKGFIIEYLNKRNIYTGNHINNLHVDQKLYQIADYLVEHYIRLEEFYKTLKHYQNIKRDFITHTNKSAIGYIRNWSRMLHNNKIIDAFTELDRQKIDIDIASVSEATRFINGRWLEIFLRAELAQFMRQNLNKIQSFDIMAQVEVEMPDHKTSELDLLLMINEKIYWFECKSGQIGSRYYNLFKKHKKYLQLPEQQSFLLVPEMNLNQAEAVKQRSGMTLLYATQIEQQLKRYLIK
jgi:hypothetical protein